MKVPGYGQAGHQTQERGQAATVLMREDFILVLHGGKLSQSTQKAPSYRARTCSQTLDAKS